LRLFLLTFHKLERAKSVGNLFTRFGFGQNFGDSSVLFFPTHKERKKKLCWFNTLLFFMGQTEKFPNTCSKNKDGVGGVRPPCVTYLVTRFSWIRYTFSIVSSDLFDPFSERHIEERIFAVANAGRMVKTRATGSCVTEGNGQKSPEKWRQALSFS
jgi:hypothetical protein